MIFQPFISIIICLTSVVASASSLTLQDFLSQVENANPGLHSARSRAEALTHRIEPAGTWEDPFFAVGLDEIPTKGEDMSSVRRYQISQTIPFPGKLGAKQQAAENRAVAAKNDSETVKRELIALATQAFYRAHYNQKAILLNDGIRKLVQDTINSTKARYKVGDAGHHDWLLSKVELSVLEVEGLRLNRERKTLVAVLNELRDSPPNSPIDELKADFSKSSDDPEIDPNSLLKSQPELSSYDAFIKAAEQDRRTARLSYFPDFVLQGMYMEPRGMPSEGSMMQPNWGFMVGVNLPIFFFRKQSEISSAANKDIEVAVLEKRSIENRLNTEILDAKEQLKTAKDTVDLYKKSVIPNTNLAAANARSGYSARRLPLTQLLETLKVQRTQELELLAAQIDVELARTRLKELLSAPPLLRLSPARPSLFGQGSMGGGGMPSGMSETVNMGKGMSGPTRKQSTGADQGGTGGGKMEGM